MRQLKITKSITNRESASLDKYLQEIGREELITAEEEVVLAKKIRDGDQDALEKLTRANLRFVVSVAKQYQNQGLSLPDLINEGNLGLIKAARRFDFILIPFSVHGGFNRCFLKNFLKIKRRSSGMAFPLMGLNWHSRATPNRMAGRRDRKFTWLILLAANPSK